MNSYTHTTYHLSQFADHFPGTGLKDTTAFPNSLLKAPNKLYCHKCFHGCREPSANKHQPATFGLALHPVDVNVSLIPVSPDAGELGTYAQKRRSNVYNLKDLYAG